MASNTLLDISTVPFERVITFSMISLISLADAAEESARLLISSATTANPRPASPARAASMEALRDRRLVWAAMDSIAWIAAPISLMAELVSLIFSVIASMASTDSLALEYTDFMQAVASLLATLMVLEAL